MDVPAGDLGWGLNKCLNGFYANGLGIGHSTEKEQCTTIV